MPETDMTDPYTTPHSNVSDQLEDVVYVGFWQRAAAHIIDSLIIVAITLPLLIAIYGKEYFLGASLIHGFADILINYILPAIAVILFWYYKSATPGKMAIGAIIVDAKTFGKPSTAQLIGRYFAYFVSMLPLFLGFIWVAFDPRKQGWHDKLAGTVVIHKR
ncbi:MAG: RDD family protein [Thioalkalispiraceae bacterium]|jgi:uncharacterized RDD family membrane protein YckC